MSAKKLFILENRMGQKVRTLACSQSQLSIVYNLESRRIEAVEDLESLQEAQIPFQLIEQVNLNQIPTKGRTLQGIGTLREAQSDDVLSPQVQLPEEEDQKNLQIYLKKSAVGHGAAILLLVLFSWISSTFFSKSQEEPTLVTIVLPKAPVEKAKPSVVPVAEKKVKPQVQKARPQQITKQGAQKKRVVSKPIPPVKRPRPQTVDLNQVGALAALGGVTSGKRGAIGMETKSLQNIQAAGRGASGGGVGRTGRGGLSGYLPGSGLVAGSPGVGARAQGAGGYGTRGSGGGQTGYGKWAIVGGSTAVGLPLDDEATMESGLDRDQIIAVINRHRGQIVYCYEKGLQAQPDIGGRVSVSFVIGPSGRVTKANVAQSSVGSRTVENCIVSRMKSWQFPQPVGRVHVDVLYPFELMRVSRR